MKRNLLITSILGLVVIFVAACSSPAAQPSGDENAGQEVEVSISNYTFEPKDLEVKVGTTVTWTNLDNVEHTVTANDGAFDSGLFGKDAAFSFTFQTAGSFPYYCIPHPNMIGTVTVVP